MDPFLEMQSRWQTFHGWFIRQLAAFAMPKAASMECWIDVERDLYVTDPSGALASIDETEQTVAFSSTAAEWKTPGAGVATLAVPRSGREIVVDPEEARQHRQNYFVVRENQKWPRALAVVELLSPANKSGNYARLYNAKRAKMLAGRTHFMEIDFLRGGENTLRNPSSADQSTPYFVFVARKTTLGRNEEDYPIRLQDRLPTIGLPLGDNRPDLPLDLAEAFGSAYELSTGGRPIQYQTEPMPEPPLSAEDATWATTLVEAIR
jgi:hypothetical protein